MSYTRTKSTYVSKTETFSYPASENGGTKSVTVNVPVEVTIYVDTNRFDANIASCKNNINLLSGAVIAAEAAEVEVKRESAQKISNSIVSGFFGYVRHGITQQIAELVTKVDSIIVHLTQLRGTCVDKQRQMGSDYERITSRYSKIFGDLDREVVVRVNALDAPTFKLTHGFKNLLDNSVENNQLGVVAVTSGEQTQAHSLLVASSVKGRAQNIIRTANKFIVDRYRQQHSFESIRFDQEKTATRYIPVMYVESVNSDSSVESNLYGMDGDVIKFAKRSRQQILSNFSSNRNYWRTMDAHEREKLDVYFNEEIESNMNRSNEHSERVINLINSMWNDNTVKAISNN